ncbi:MAG: MFS transporter [Pseudoxanthomonas sp.]
MARAGGYAWFVLTLLTAVYAFNWVDRYLLIILIEPISTDLGISDTSMGLLIGFAYALVYSIAGLGIGRLADHASRKRLIALAVAGWSAFTMLSGLARGFFGLAAARASVAVCASGCTPPAYSLISDYFPAHRRGTAIAIYSLGISFGIWIGLAAGGWLNEHYGWRTTFLVMSAPGLLLALAVLAGIREPRRGQQDGAAAETGYGWREALALMWRRRAFAATTLGLALASFGGSGFEMWTSAYLVRTLGMGTAQVGALSGMVEGSAGILGTLLAGILADCLGRRDERWYLWLPLLGIVAIVPLEWLFLYHGHGVMLYVSYFLAILGTSSYTAPLMALGQLLLPPRLRGLGTAVMLLFLNIIGTGAGSFWVGLVSDLLKSAYGEAALRHAILSSQVGTLAGVACILYAVRRLPLELARIRGGHAVVDGNPRETGATLEQVG